MIILFPVAALSQNMEKIDGKGEARRNNKNEIGFFKTTANIEAITNKNDFFSTVLNIAKTDEYKFEKKGDSEKERRFEVYRQYYGGVPVKDGVYVLHWENGKLESANGNYIRISKLDPKPTFTEKEALEIWCNYQKIPTNEISRSKIELFVVDLNGADETKTESNVVLAYRIRLFSININNSLIGYIDAHTGEVCLTEPIAITSSFSDTKVEQNYGPMPLTSSPPPPATGTFATRYSGPQSAITESRNNQFFLEDWSRTNGIITRNRNNQNAADTTGVTPFADNNNTWTTAEWDNTNKDNTALDIHWALQKIYDYYLNVHGRRGWDSIGQRTNAYVHSLILDNSGLTKDNAAYYPDGEYLAFGDGESKFKPLGSVDVVAHEYAHGINDHTSGFSGGGINSSFNEGLSDIWAATIESYVAPQKNKWKIGEEVMLTKSCLRNLMTPSDPTADWPIAHTYGTSEYNSNSEAYYRSGILSHWFYLLSEGGSGTNGLGNSYTVYGLGIETAARLVYFAQARRYLNGTTTYPLMRTNMMSATDASFGANSFQSLQVANAWYAVGVGSNPGQVTISGPQTVCYSSASTFTANSAPTGFAISWSVSDNTLSVVSGGNTSTPLIRPISSSSRDAGWIQAKFTSSIAPTITSDGPKVNVSVNGPYYKDISFDVYKSDGTHVTNSSGYTPTLCANTTYHIFVVNNGSCSTSNYSWTIPSGWTNFYTSGNMISINTNSASGGNIIVAANTSCNNNVTIISGYMSSGSCGGYYLVISPNPSVSETSIELKADSETTLDENLDWDLDVYDSFQGLKEKKTKLKTKETKINTSGWKDGVYIVRATVGDKVVTEKMMVKH